CGGGVAADSSVSNGFVSSADGAWSAAVGATTTESAGAGCSSSSSSLASTSIDDILIYSRNKEENANHLRIILELLYKEKLYAKFSKCNFWISVMQFLGHIIDNQGLHVDPAKIEAIKNRASPTTPTEIRYFLGLGEDQEPTFQLLKQKLCEASILALPEGNDDFIVYYDASHQGLGAVLMQREKKELNMRQRHWLELLADYACEIRYHPRKANHALGTQLDMSMTYHPKTDGQSERTIQTLKDMLQAYVIDFGKGWRKPLEFQVGDLVMLKVSPRKGIIRFGKRGKLNPRYIGPFEILERIGQVAYKLELPEDLSNIHSTFHVSNLKKFLSNESLSIPMKELRLDDKLNFVEELVEIMD
nr:putative reverse transcriptase domain-containing protein [Tanacetum cinerariifolium]